MGVDVQYYSDGTVEILKNTGALDQDIIVTVPVSISHWYGDHPHDVNVVITFKK